MTLMDRLRALLPAARIKRTHEELITGAQCCRDEIEHRQHEITRRLHVLEWMAGVDPDAAPHTEPRSK